MILIFKTCHQKLKGWCRRGLVHVLLQSLIWTGGEATATVFRTTKYASYLFKTWNARDRAQFDGHPFTVIYFSGAEVCVVKWCFFVTWRNWLLFSYLAHSNFSNYRNRFSMPGQTESLWYRWAKQIHVDCMKHVCSCFCGWINPLHIWSGEVYIQANAEASCIHRSRKVILFRGAPCGVSCEGLPNLLLYFITH